MAADAAALLDQLMGRSRNALSSEEVRKDHWSDPDICKYFLCGFCPSDLFINTKSDIGACDKIHDEELRLSYEASEEKGTKGYEEQFLDYLEKLIRDLDRRIQRGKERLERSATANQEAFNEKTGFMYTVRLKELGEEIDKLIAQSHELGQAGQVDEAQELIKRVETLEKEKDREKAMQMMLNSNVPQVVAGFELDPGNFHEKNEICDVCGCFLIIGDTQARIDAHLMGKQHLGYARIRHTITELKKAREERLAKVAEERRKRRESQLEQRSPRRARRSKSPERHRRPSHRSPGRRRSRSRDRDQRRRRSRSRERRRSRSRERRGSRSRDHKRSRSRERGRYRSHRSRSRERRRSRSRERRRSKDKRSGRRSRSRSKERRRSRSRDRAKRSRSKEGRSQDKKQRRSKSASRSRSGSRSRKDRSKSKEAVEANNGNMDSNVNGETA